VVLARFEFMLIICSKDFLQEHNDKLLIEARQPPKVCARLMYKTLGSYTTYMVAISNGSGYGAVENLARFKAGHADWRISIKILV